MTKLPATHGEALAALEANRQALSWRERRALAEQLAPVLAKNVQEPAARGLLELFFTDPKPEVRRQAADLLELLPLDDARPLAARLAQDDNAFVREAAERALERARQAQRESTRKYRDLVHIEEEFDEMRRLYGEKPTARARYLAEQLFDFLVACTVHEMRNLLGGLVADSETLQEHVRRDSFPVELFQEVLVRMRQDQRFFERLLSDLRTFVKPLPPERHTLWLSELVGEAVARARESVRQDGVDTSAVKLTVDVPEQIKLEAARHELVVAFLNVIKNAYHFAARGEGAIEIRARDTGDGEVEVVIADTGSGMSQATLQAVRAFVPGTTTRRNQGTGCGLPIAARHVRGHGGTFEIDSRPDQGTTVTIRLPVQRGDQTG